MLYGSILCLLGALWGMTLGITASVILAFITGAAALPTLWLYALLGALSAWLVVFERPRFGRALPLAAGFLLLSLGVSLLQPFQLSLAQHTLAQLGVLLALCALWVWSFLRVLQDLPAQQPTRHHTESVLMRFFMAFGYLIFTALVAIPFYVMLMTSLKSQQALLASPLDFSLDLSQGLGLFRSYVELFRDYHFGDYLLTSFVVSLLTVLITLAFSVPGAYAVARLRFKGRVALSRSILLIYMVPMIVLALPIYIAFSLLGLRNTITGIVLIYPMTTIPVALYMLQGYFRALPSEIEEAGIMDGLSRIAVIIKITLPLSLPAIASVSLYVFMIAWNEFLLAFMLLDDPSQFTLTRGVSMLNSSEIPRQHLMAGAVIATLPILFIFLTLERFMSQGLTAGAVKG